MVLFGSVIFILSILLFYRAWHLHRKTKITQKTQHIQPGVITYSDLNVPANPMFSKRLHLTGKPDYIVKQRGNYIPIEVKSGQYRQPPTYHILQLAAYCHLIEETYQCFVPHGILVYPDNHFTIPFDPTLRFHLESTIRSMRNSMKKGSSMRNHNDPKRCRHCSMKTQCKENLM